MKTGFVAINTEGSYFAGGGRGTDDLDEAILRPTEIDLREVIFQAYKGRPGGEPKWEPVPVEIRITKTKKSNDN